MEKEELSDEQWGKKIQDVEFWKKRYETHREGDENFEWYCGYAQIADLFEDTVGEPTFETRILDLGCGSSTLSVEMRNAGYSVVGIDYVKDQIEFLNRKFKNMEHLSFVCGDFRDYFESLDAKQRICKSCVNDSQQEILDSWDALIGDGEVLELLERESVEAIAGVRNGATKAQATSRTLEADLRDEDIVARLPRHGRGERDWSRGNRGLEQP